MHLVTDGVGESLPAVPVVFVATVFDGVDRVFFGEFFKVCCLLFGVALCAAFTFELRVVIDTVLLTTLRKPLLSRSLATSCAIY